MLLIYINNYSIAVACLWINASKYSVFLYVYHLIYISKKCFNLFFNIKNSDTEYRKLLSESYEYEYEEYPDLDNYGSNNPQDTKSTSIGSAKKTLIRSNTHPNY